MTDLCVPIFVQSREQARRDALLAAEHGADLIEYRIDTFTDTQDLDLLGHDSPVPCILTCRSVEEGGQSDLSDEERVKILDYPYTPTPRYVDLELQTFKRLPSASVVSNSALILSAHDFKSRPDRLYNILAEMNALPGNINKVVWTARTIRDNIEPFEILLTRQN